MIKRIEVTKNQIKPCSDI